MNKTECKKYLRKAFNNIKKQNKTITIENLEREMNKIIEIDSNIYIDYSKIALKNLLAAPNEITAQNLTEQIDIIQKIYTERQIILKANK